MSSGVDSSVCAALFAKSGIYKNVKGIYMQNWGQDSEPELLINDHNRPCYEKDWKDVMKVADFLQIPVEKVNFSNDYWLDVFEPMIENYELGLTPNPDIGCNRYIKFGKLIDYLDNKYKDEPYYLVTGHYARVLESSSNGNKYDLYRGYYRKKDQSYYLSQINGSILSKLILPIGHLTKPEVREWANLMNLPTANKPDSQGICFVNNSQSKGNFSKFLESYISDSKSKKSNGGNIITIDPETGAKKVWGQHNGLWSYTIGQKINHISLPQGDPKYKGQWFVGKKLKNTNEIVIVKGRNNPSLFHNIVKVKDFEFIHKHSNFADFLSTYSIDNLNIQYRSLQTPNIKIENLKLLESVDSNNKQDTVIEVTLKDKQRAMVPGQYCCIYENDKVIGSGIITE
ncbi:tRNA-5-taurinomethyluridine 2-sulfurtransferase SCDLUD_002552 [Saccharomycodes ludwigii]|uniref:tRNA-5-taurinomethyluridine 2-sulfurtransferase n=1 Tax=Saccharomycodes ludwigii TaxID=36035 RepID=UPI001E8884F6|nr:hypothetical protein SCDLUD_002552 [Saccharomycodes ludwigii]KAH3901077.1 hypothetical protein SCDLUD_002552 [Saccharomycodes ludwigii]